MRLDVLLLRRLANGLRTPYGRRGLRKRTVATMMPTSFLKDLGADLVVDVGANRGQFLIDVRDSLPDARVVAFEPLPSEFSVLRSIHERTGHIDLRMIAIGDRVGEVTMHVSQAADSSSTLPITRQQERVYPGTGEVGTISVPTSTLDEELGDLKIPTNSLLKIDVQGGEIAVLQGASETLPRFGFVLVEASFLELYAGQPLVSEVVELLANQGFVLDRVLSLSVVRGRPIQADFVFRNGRIDEW